MNILGYVRMVRELGEDADYIEDEALLILNARDAIERSMPNLSAAERRQVAEIDDLLIQKAGLIALILPNPNFIDRCHWWWFLHEGPQVREQAHQLQTV